ncbi:hypothetical protein H0H93_001358 [Arthromyces matolae]|nr:hypothetical protein H0H93_001358 [Arthromyces matolae]
MKIDKRVPPERGVIASVMRNYLHFEDKAPSEPLFVPDQTKFAYVVFVDETLCLEIAPVNWGSSQNPYFVSFESLYLGNSVEWFTGSIWNRLGVYLRLGTLSPASNGGAPLFTEVMEEKKVRPTIEDAKRMLEVPVAGFLQADFHKLVWGSPADGTPAQFREGMIGTVSYENFQEDTSLPSLPWERRRKCKPSSLGDAYTH